MIEKKTGFAPIFDENSSVLILGSFPSVKSREIEFYYGNKQNRFWKMICGYFGETIPPTVEGKKAFLLQNKIALWDMVLSCEIQGSADSSIKNVEVADIDGLINQTKIKRVLLNGTLAYDLFTANYKGSVPYAKMPSTSPANPRYNEKIWYNELDKIFKK